MYTVSYTHLYQNIMRIEKDENGNIISIDTDAAALNLLKTKINLQIQEKLKSYEKQEFLIPIGTLLGSDLFLSLIHILNFIWSDTYNNAVYLLVCI